MMFKSLPIALLLVISIILPLSVTTAQDTGIQYKFNDFRFPDIDRKGLSAFVFLNGNSHLQNVNSNSRSSIGQFSNTLSLGYSRYRNLEKIQSLESIEFQNAINLYNRKIPMDSSRIFFSVLPRYTNEFKYYYKPSRFWGIDLNLEADFSHFSTRTTSGIYDVTTNQLFTDLSPTIQYGWGRLEPIDDVFLAKFMLDDLLEAGILEQELSQEELFELGSVMAFVPNQRVFDTRRLRMYELTEIDKWFTASGKISIPDFRYFTVLNDNWLYSYRNTRFTGKRFTIGLTPQLKWTSTFNPDFVTPAPNYGLFLGLDYEKHRAINQFWQSIFTVSGGISSIFLEDSFFRREPKIGPNFSISQSYGWYPNSRTRVTGGLFASFLTDFSLNATPIAGENFIRAGLNFQADYFVNYRFKILGALDYGHTYQNIDLHFNNNFTIYTNSLQYEIRLIYTFF